MSIFTWAQELSFTVQPSNLKVGIDDYFQITYNISNAEDIKDFVPPNFDNFRLQGNPSQSNSKNINIYNGKQIVNNTVALTFTFKPTKIGSFNIGTASVVLEGKKYLTQPVPVQVVKESQVQQYDPWNSDPFEEFFNRRNVNKSRAPKKDSRFEPFTEKNLANNIFIKLHADKKSAYIGEQINVSYKLYTRLPMNMALSKLPMLNGFWSQDLEVPQQQNLPTEEKINGVPFQVYTLKKSALFPQQTGQLILDAAKAEGLVKVLALPTASIQESNDPFEAFFGPNPFGGEYGDYEFKDVKAVISSTNVPIQVKPLPPADSQLHFSGAVGNFKIQSSITSEAITTNESIIYKIDIFGNGNVKLIGRPTFPFDAKLNVVDGNESDTILSRYPSIQGIKSFEYVINPDEAGDYTIPAFQFAYFDVNANAYKSIQTQVHSIKVAKGSSVAGQSAEDPVYYGILPANSYVAQSNSNWWAVFTILGLAIVNFVIYLFHKKSLAAKIGDFQQTRSISKTALKRLTAAKLRLNTQGSAFYEEISKAIWLYISERFRIPLASLNKEAALHTLQSLNLDDTALTKYNKIIESCEMALYAKNETLQERTSLLGEAAELITLLEQVLKSKKARPGSFTAICIFIMIGLGATQVVHAADSTGVQASYNQLIALCNNDPVAIYNKAVSIIDEKQDKVIALALLEKAYLLQPSFKEAYSNIQYVEDNLQLANEDTIDKNILESLLHVFTLTTWLVIAILVLLAITVLHFFQYKGVVILFYKRIQIILLVIFVLFLTAAIAHSSLLSGIRYGIVTDTMEANNGVDEEVKVTLSRGQKIRILKMDGDSILALNNKLQTIAIPKENLLIID